MLNNSAQIYQIMKSINTNKYKRSVKYNKIPLKLLHNKGDYHMFKGLKHQLELGMNPKGLVAQDLSIANFFIKFLKISFTI